MQHALVSFDSHPDSGVCNASVPWNLFPNQFQAHSGYQLQLTPAGSLELEQEVRQPLDFNCIVFLIQDYERDSLTKNQQNVDNPPLCISRQLETQQTMQLLLNKHRNLHCMPGSCPKPGQSSHTSDKQKLCTPQFTVHLFP